MTSPIITDAMGRQFIDSWSKIQWTEGDTPGILGKPENIVNCASECISECFKTLGITFDAWNPLDVGTDLSNLASPITSLPTPVNFAQPTPPGGGGMDGQDSLPWSDEYWTEVGVTVLIYALGVAHNRGLVKICPVCQARSNA